MTVTGTSAVVALKDLTGFDGRCDAVAFISGSDAPPPAGGDELKLWRRTVKNEAEAPADVRSFDCVITGGGMAGCCAALAAARSGITVALVHDRPVLGGNASQEVRVGTRGAIRNSIVDEIDTLALGNRDDATVTSDAGRLARIQAEANIILFMPWRAEDAGTNATGRITHVDARHVQNGQRVRLQAPIFIDCTGDGWIGYWAGADYRMGTEAQAEFGESRAPAAANTKTMGNSLMWKTKTGAAASTFPAVPWAMDVAGTRAATGGDWDWEYGMSLNTIEDAEGIRDHLLRAIYGNFSNAKKLAANANLQLDWVPYVSGKRESRRLVGDHVLTQQDHDAGVFFEDAVGTTDWGIDLHWETSVSYISNYTKSAIASPCYFPFRSLYSRNVPNLLMAGRAMSSTHVGMGSVRVQNTTGQMGVAVGYAAALCKQYGIEPRDIYRNPDRTIELQARIGGVWPARPATATGIVVDNADTTGLVKTGTWTLSTYDTGYYGTNYMHDGDAGKGTKSVVFRPALPAAGRYEVLMRWTAAPNRTAAAPVSIATRAGVAPVAKTVNQQVNGAQWNSLGTYDFDPATAAVTLSNTGTTGHVIADAVMFALPGADPDRDGDRLPDWWERWHFLSEIAAEAAPDADGDGQSNYAEYVTGCDPNDAASKFDARMAVSGPVDTLDLRWPSVEGRTYAIETSTDCKSWTPLESGNAATPPENTRPVTPGPARRYYRIAAEP
ncbi:MAG: FAD-dependent oxidoreductase [Kiritimatiellia bacterium]